jgi:hypothetical protein
MLPSLLSSRINFEPMDIKDFRPIGLVSEVYKIIAKAVANRLRRL